MQAFLKHNPSLGLHTYLGRGDGKSLMITRFEFEYQPLFFNKKLADPGLFYRLFSVFSIKHHYIFTTNMCEKCPSSIQLQDLNPPPSEHESPPITTNQHLLLDGSFSHKFVVKVVILLYRRKGDGGDS